MLFLLERYPRLRRILFHTINRLADAWFFPVDFNNRGQISFSVQVGFTNQLLRNVLRTFARNFSNIDFFLKILPSKDDELVMSEM